MIYFDQFSYTYSRRCVLIVFMTCDLFEFWWLSDSVRGGGGVGRREKTSVKTIALSRSVEMTRVRLVCEGLRDVCEGLRDVCEGLRDVCGAINAAIKVIGATPSGQSEAVGCGMSCHFQLSRGKKNRKRNLVLSLLIILQAPSLVESLIVLQS